MDFVVTREDSRIRVIIQHDDQTLFNHELPSSDEDNIHGWQARLVYLHEENPKELEDLLSALPHLLSIRISDEVLPTYRNILHSAFRFLEQYISREAQEDAGSYYAHLYRQLEEFLFCFKAKHQLKHYRATFYEAGREEWVISIPCREFDEAPVQVCLAALAASLRKESSQQKKSQRGSEQNKECQRESDVQQDSEGVRNLIENYTHFQRVVANADSTTIRIFSGFSKALVELINRQIDDLGMYASAVPGICAFIVKNELEDVEQQKAYLQPILSSREDEARKLHRLDEIVCDIKQDIHQRNQRGSEGTSQSNKQQGDNHARLMQVISLISEHYLNVYDLDHSIDFWEKANSRDLVLRLFLLFHRRPILALVLQIACLGIPSYFSYQHWRIAETLPLSANSLDLRSSTLVILYAVFLVLLIAILVQLFRGRWLYSQLLLPRLLGASIVGLAVLLLDDLPWRIGVRCGLVNWLVVTFFTYSGSFLYIFIEIYSTTKFVQGHSIRGAIGISGRVYLIALSETLFIVTVASTVVVPVVESSEGLGSSLGLCVNLYTSLTPGRLCNWLSFGIYPALILLWTGVALFIGSFVQLMWQEKQITAPV